MDLKLCTHCGETVDSDAPHHQECIESHIPTCQAAVTEYRDTQAQMDFVLYMAVHANYIYGLNEQKRKAKKPETLKKEKREKRNVKLQELLKYVSALRNSSSGYLLIQLVGFAVCDTYTGEFDVFADEKLLEVIDDGSLFADVFKKNVFQFNNQTFVVLYVEGTSHIATFDCKTALALDSSIRKPNPATLRRFVSRKSPYPLRQFQSPVKADYRDLQFTESRRIQIKGVDKLKGSLREKIWKELRLREYISAFSKNEEGGVVIIGVGEGDKSFQKFSYQSKTWDFHGVSMETFEEVKARIEHCVKQEMSVYGFDGKRRDDTEIIKEIKSVNISTLRIPNMEKVEEENKQNVLIEVSVHPIDGVVFYHEEGPLAYKVEQSKDNPKINICRQIDIPTWFDKMK